MVKKKTAPKSGGGGASKKADHKKKTKIIEDKTFGLKNKNKSKKVQSHIQSVTKNVLNSGDPKQKKIDELRVKIKAEAKARKKAAEQERNALFGEALLAVKKKTTTKTKSESESKGRDHEEGKVKIGQSRAMKMMFQMDAKEMEDTLKADPNYVPTIEDEVELQRQRKLAELRAKGIKGTPVTHETFKAWQDRKWKRRQEEARRKVEAEMRKKKGGKGLSILSGRDLFEYDRDLFKDDGGSSGAENVDVDGVVDGDEKKTYDIEKISGNIESNLFLDCDDDDLDDLDDLDDD